MAIIKRLKDTLGNIIYPQTITKAVYDDNNNVLDDVLNEKVSLEDIPLASYNKKGLVQFGGDSFGLKLDAEGSIYVAQATDNNIRSGYAYDYRPIIPANQHRSVFYGLAKASGDTTQSQSSNPVGQYTNEAKAKISAMIEPKFELIESFTLTEDEPITRETEPNGTPYNFKKVIVEIITPPWTLPTTWFPIFANTDEFSGIMIGALSVSTNATRYYTAFGEIMGGRFMGHCVWGSGYTNGQDVVSSTGAMGHYSGNYINKITAGTSNGTMPSGTQVKIYGMRA